MQAMTHSNDFDFEEAWKDEIPEIAWGTVGLFFGILLGYAITIPIAFSGTLPYAVAALICGVLAFASFTVMHDAGHGGLIKIGSRFKFMEKWFGWVCVHPVDCSTV